MGFRLDDRPIRTAEELRKRLLALRERSDAAILRKKARRSKKLQTAGGRFD